MKMSELQALARTRGEKPGRRTKLELIRHLQQAEGNQECFRTGQLPVCAQADCLWRGDCA